MAIAIELLQYIMDRTLTYFFEREIDALLGGVNERNSCGRLAMYMQRFAAEAGLPEYYVVDTEYNRKQGRQIKTILGDGHVVITINPDLILHSRGRSIAEDNLIVVEMKKSGRPNHEKQADRDRLIVMTRSSFDGIWSNDGTAHPKHVCGYRLGVYIELANTIRQARIEYYRDGELAGSSTRTY